MADGQEEQPPPEAVAAPTPEALPAGTPKEVAAQSPEALAAQNPEAVAGQNPQAVAARIPIGGMSSTESSDPAAKPPTMTEAMGSALQPAKASKPAATPPMNPQTGLNAPAGTLQRGCLESPSSPRSVNDGEDAAEVPARAPVSDQKPAVPQQNGEGASSTSKAQASGSVMSAGEEGEMQKLTNDLNLNSGKPPPKAAPRGAGGGALDLSALGPSEVGSSSALLGGASSSFGDDKKDEVVARAQVPFAQYSEHFPVPDAQVGPQHFEKLKLLGRGGIGKVYLVALKGHNRLYAMKVLTKEEMIARNKVKRVMTEREILATVNHPFIVTMYASFQTVNRLCFVMEYCAGGEFFRVLQNQPKRRLSESATRFYAAEVTLALEYLHHMGFIYRDLKPENILMRESGHIALTDFDLSKQAHAVSPRVIQQHLKLMDRIKAPFGMKKSDSKLNMLDIVDSEPVLPYATTSFVGTEEYIAPEVVSGAGQSSAMDWWTLGILIYEMLTGTTPFKGSYVDETFSNITSTNIKWPDEVDVSADCKNIVKKLLKRDPLTRLGAENGASDIKKHKWFAGHISMSLIRNQTPPIKPRVPNPKDFTQYKAFKDEEEEGQAMDDKKLDNPFHNFSTRRDSDSLNRRY